MDADELNTDPLATLADWLDEAETADEHEPTAMCLATVDDDGTPDARMVLLKGVDERGLRFFTNRLSTKGMQLAQRPAAAVVLQWPSLHRQVRARGTVTELPDTESDAYFASRDRTSQLGAWASAQSRPIGSRAELESAFAAVEERFAGGPVPRPPHWGGYLVSPTEVELWQGRRGRLHDRLRYRRSDPAAAWEVTRLQP